VPHLVEGQLDNAIDRRVRQRRQIYLDALEVRRNSSALRTARITEDPTRIR